MIKKLFVVHHTHTDIGYTDIQTKIMNDHVDFIDKVLDYCKETDNYPEESKFKWTCEVSWTVKNYLKKRPERINEFIQRVKEGRIEVTGLYLNVTELYTAEELIRSLYFAKKLEKNYGIKVVSAMNSDVPGLSWGLPQIFPGAGIKYLSMAPNSIRAKRISVPQPFYWISPDESRVLVWTNNDSYGAGYNLGLGSSYKTFSKKLPEYLRHLENKNYPYDAYCLRMAMDNVDPHIELSKIAREWNEKHVSPQIIVSTNKDFFEYMEKKYKNKFPSYKLAWPDWWADGSASAAYETGLSRKTKRRLKVAEALLALQSFYQSPYPKREIDNIWDNLMFFDEHTWGATSTYGLESPIAKGSWAIKSSFIYNAVVEAERLLKKAKILTNRKDSAGKKDVFNLELLLLQEHSDSLKEIVVFSPFFQSRKSLISFTMGREALKEKFHVKDGKEILPIQVEKIDREVPWKKEEAKVSFVATIPSFGYKTFEVISRGSAYQSDFSFGKDSIENNFYKVSLDHITGGIKSIYDKQLGRELVEQKSPYRVNQCIYEEAAFAGGKNPLEQRETIFNAIKFYGVTSAIKERDTKFRRFSPTISEIKRGKDGTVMGSLISEAKLRKCRKIIQEVILYHDLKRIDIVNTIFKEETLNPEAVYYAFPFNFKNPEIKFEIAGASMRPEIDQLPGSAKDYYSIQDWVSISDKDCSVVWTAKEAPLVQFGEINTGKWLSNVRIKNGTLFSWIMNNYWFTNFRASQGGKSVFHYSLTSCKGKINNSTASLFAQECNNSSISLAIDKNLKVALPKKYSFISLDKKNVSLLALKGAEDKKGLILRLIETDGRDTVIKITLPFLEIKKAYQTNLVEENQKEISAGKHLINMSIKSFGIATIRIQRFEKS
ncbi:MAG: glycoside hydrolase family 38 C-terminal domain-containing protein [bacterium]|nr:glycoside hydrolase family 38 C-terminal domain-containing protein [bacterium]